MTAKAVAKISDFDDSKMLAIEFDGMPIVLILEKDGSVSALHDCCSHEEVKLSEGAVESGEITCLRHGARFETKTGKQLCLPAVRPVKSYSCAVQEGLVYLDISG
ncbi:MAG: Rieske 2Fe-2S domain-containing protein [SAR324 cluster bacterium]|uniref:Rieske 2Fe-2S domain-containing protein n=1 Tax=SAR324 cluster bacterium TaxID=2024889 RepID=A0A7X9FU52_9DELT|nr:Rieske 2Fe-2S domain-containing protein [SAR324 cluster bacterium]